MKLAKPKPMPRPRITLTAPGRNWAHYHCWGGGKGSFGQTPKSAYDAWLVVWKSWNS